MPAVASIGLPVVRFVDLNGRPAIGGRVRTFVAGTDTLAPTYTDATGATPNANPIILNARGECTIWFDTTLVYDIAPEMANGTDLPRQNGVTTARSVAVTSDYRRTGTITQTRSLQSKLDDVPSIFDYDTTAGSGNDDSAAVQGMLSQGAGYTLNFPIGKTFNVGVAGLALLSNTTIRGGGCVIKASGAPSSGFVRASSLSNIDIQGLVFDAGEFPSVANVAMLDFNLTTGVRITNCRFKGFDRFALAVNGGSDIQIVGNTIKRTTPNNFTGSPTAAVTQNQGIIVSSSAGQVADLYIMRNVLTNSGMDVAATRSVIGYNHVYGWKFGGGITTEQDPACNQLKIVYNHCEGGVGVDINATAVPGIENWAAASSIIGNTCIGNAGSGIDQGGLNCTVDGNTCINNGVVGGSGITSRYGLPAYNASGSSYSANRCYNTTGGTQSFGYSEESATLVNIRLDASNNFGGNAVGVVHIVSPTTTYIGPAVEATTSYAAGTLATAARLTTTINVVGARAGDLVQVSFGNSLTGVQLSGYVSADNIVTAIFANNTGASVTLGTAMLVARCEKTQASADF